MWPKLLEFYTYFLEISKSNPVLAGVVSLYGLGVATFILKDVPRRIYAFFCDEFTTTLTLNSQDRVYYDMLNWVSKNKFHSWVRTLNLNNSRWGASHTTHLTIGYGRIYFTFGFNIFRFQRHEVEANNTEHTKERITITVLGRNQSVLKNLIKEVIKKAEDESAYTKIYTHRGDWEFMTRKYKRGLDTVVLDREVKNKVIKHLDTFLSQDEQEWYVNNGVTYKTGILLTGGPGTGKTSMVKALCAHYEKDLYILSLTGMSDTTLTQALASVPEGSIVAIEDIDGFNINLNRASAGPEEGDNGSSSPITMLTISGVLNAIDGITSAEKIILIATTNYPKKLDKALLREGRFDLIVELGYMTDESFKEYFHKFFPKHKIDKSFRLKKNIAPCTVQKLIFDNRNNPDKVLAEVKR